ncbi:MAG: DUF2341 domain-containing protein, partial [Anaerolineales bacterium]
MFELPVYTWSMWIRGNSAPAGGSNTQPIRNADEQFQFNWNQFNAAYRQGALHKDSVDWQAAQIATPLSGNTWYYIVGTYDGSNIRVYLNDGLEDTQPAGTPNVIVGDLEIGGDPAGNNFAGHLDEFRISNLARPLTWIATEYNNQSSPSTFYTVGGEELFGKTMNNTIGTPGATLVFDTAGQDAYWYSELSYPTGSEDAAIASGDYTLEMNFSAQPAAWYDTDWLYRKKITITGNADTAVSSGETVRISLDTASLVSATKMQTDGDDLRIVYWNGASWVELNRQLFQMNTAATDVWFPLQATIANAATDGNYYLHYGNGSAVSPPTNLGTTTSLDFYAGDGNSVFQDAGLECGAGASTNYNDYTGTGRQKSDQEDIDSTSCDGLGFGIVLGLAEWSNFYGTAAWQVPTGARVVEDGTSAGSRIRLWATTNRGHKLEASSVLEGWVDTQVTWNDRQTGTAWTGNGGAGATLAAPTSGDLTGFDDTSSENQISASMGTDTALWGGTAGVEGPAFPFQSSAGTIQRWVTSKLTNNGVAIHMRATGLNNGVEWYGEEHTIGTQRPRLTAVFYDHYQPEPGTGLSVEEDAPYVQITVSVHHTKTDGTVPVAIVTSSTTTIDANTPSPLILTIGNDPTGQTYTAADPQMLRTQINVVSVNGGGNFTLAYDSAADDSNLDTPTLTVPELTLLFVAAVAVIPLLTFVLTERRRRRMALRLLSVGITALVVMGLLAQDVTPALAAPDTFYLHTNPLNGGEDMNITAGTGAATKLFNTAAQTADWFTDITYPTGADDATIAAGAYTLNMYFNTLPSASGWWNTAYDYRQQVTVTAGSTAIPSGYSTLLTFDHAALVAAGKALNTGDDLRVLFWNGGSFVELDRALDDGSSWDNASTSIWFKTQAAIAASGTDTNYYLYYGNSGATGPPANKSNIFLFWDDFESETIGSVPSAWTEKDPSFDWSVQVDPTDGTNQLLRARNVNDNYVYTTSNLGAYDTELQARIYGQSVDPSVALAHRYNGAEPVSYRARQRTGPSEFHIWKRSGNCSLGSSAFTFPANTWVIQRARATDSGSDVVLDYRTWEEATPSTFAQVNATDAGAAPGCAQLVNQAYQQIGIYASESLEDLLFDDVRVRLYVTPEPTTPLSAELPLPSVDITVSVVHTKADGTDPQPITSASTTIDANTADPLALGLGSGAAQTFTQADPRHVRVRITVDAINNGGSFDLAYDSALELSSLDTPSLTVPEFGLLLAFVAVFIPILTALLTMRRKRAVRIIGVMLSLVIAISLLATQIGTVSAAPDVFYLHDNSTP